MLWEKVFSELLIALSGGSTEGMSNIQLVILNALRRRGPMCPSQIAAATGLRIGAIEAEIDNLIERHKIKIVGKHCVRIDNVETERVVLEYCA